MEDIRVLCKALDLQDNGAVDAALINRGSTAEYLKPAEAFLERALQLDPNNVDALAAKGWVDMGLGAGFMTDDHAARLASAEATAIKALSLAPNHACLGQA
jgi:tetratricopeptide (TPR) repeat protein